MRKTAIALLLSLGGMCFADTLILNDGSRHEGTLQGATASSISFKENGKVSRYSRSRIQSIEFSGAVASDVSGSSSRASSGACRSADGRAFTSASNRADQRT